MKKIINTENAPEAIGPYSQAIKSGNLLFISGQIAIVPGTGQILREDIEQETSQVLKNIRTIVNSAGGEMEDIVKTTIFLTDISQFERVNEVYKGFFRENPPARATVEVSNLPEDSSIEVEAIAVLTED